MHGMTDYKLHHVAISVSDVNRSLAFYENFGFRPALTWKATDGSLELIHLQHPSGAILEVVHYAANNDAVPKLPGVGNDLQEIGVKHFALHVDEDLEDLRNGLLARGLGEVTEISHGRTGFDLFFIRDPDGWWMELLSDKRSLDVENPTVIEDAPRLLPGE